MIPDYSKAHILVAVDVVLDEYLLGATRISPDAPAPIIKVPRVEYRSGAAANVACSLAGLGSQVRPLKIVGKLVDAESLKTVVRESGFASERPHSEARPTIRKLHALNCHQQSIRLGR